VSSLVAFTGFKRSSKYSLHFDRISFSSLRMSPEGSLMEELEFDLLPRKRRIVRQNTLFADRWLESYRRPNFSHDFSLDFFTANAAAFRASVYRDCKSDDDLFCNKALNASFLTRRASLTSWFHQGVFSHYPPPLSAAFAHSIQQLKQ